MNNQPAKSKIFIQALKVAALFIFLLGFILVPASTQAAAAPVPTSMFSSKISNCNTMGHGQSAQDAVGYFADPKKISVFDEKVNGVVTKVACIDTRNGVERALDQAKSWAIDKAWKELLKSGDIAWRQALKYFLNTLAYDMATYIATGDKGQLPMFETQGWGGYLSNVADNAAGTFIESLGQNMSTLKFNLCQPNLQLMLRINLGLMYTVRPPKPPCTFTEMTKNWQTAVQSKDFLPKFQDMFNPYSSDLGVALSFHSALTGKINEEVSTKTKDREEGKGWRPVRSAVDNRIKTPTDIVGAAARQPIKDSTASEKIHTGTILADSVDIFINTLIGKLITRWLKGGIVTDMPTITNKLDSLANSMGQNLNEGVTGAKARLRSLVEPDFKVRADYDILAELVTCGDPNKAGPTNCVIDEKFRQAIEKKMTVGQALKEGYLSNTQFGFLVAGSKDNNNPEPMYNEGYPYRSMIILRKYRIIPVGWEVAAEKINDGDGVNAPHTLGDLVACYSNTDDYTGYFAAWCEGLVDPDWVLKAPQNFCRREGSGAQIVSEQVTGEGAGSSLAVLRNDSYCADEQSCIKEKTDGSCQLYGYCTEERRKWDFNAKSCEPRYNTCRTFNLSNSSNSQTVSYLENTLDFRNCNLGNSGCLDYCRSYGYLSGKFSCTGTTGSKIHLSGQAETCDQASEGCHELIRLNPGGGANLLINSGFEDDLTKGSWSGFGVLSTPGYQGTYGLAKNDDTKTVSHEIEVGGSDYSIAGESYTLSFYAKGCTALTADEFWLGTDANSENLNSDVDWTRYSLSYTYPLDETGNKVSFGVNSASCLLDNIKLERGTTATPYSDYAAAASPSLIHEKIMPSYLALACRSNNPPEVCKNFARLCSADEAGCELYTGVQNETKVPAKVSVQDYCPAECVGYNTFMQSESFFDSLRPAYFIPKTAKTCSAEVAGCDQFTNLDEVKKGGEGVGYFSYLRQCLKKSENEASCADFYTWEGSDESGYQLKTESLKFSGSGPALSGSEAEACTEAVYNLPPSDPAYNPDCRQYYNRQGGITYHSHSRTISCTDDCHPYRRTAVNIDETITSQAACGGINCSNAAADRQSQCWDSDSSQCVACKNGGTWSGGNKACLYLAVPSEGVACSASQNGCREYIGNTGNDLRKIFTDDFRSGTFSPWSGINGSTIAASNDSLTLGPDGKGHSIRVSPRLGASEAEAMRPIGSAVSSGLSYVLNLVVKADAPASLIVGLGNGLATTTFATMTLNTNWQIFEINLTSLHDGANASEVLAVKADKSFNINNISLTEIVDRYYLIKGSWKTPASCDQDSSQNPYLLYALGCDQYKDRAGKTNNLRQFSKLCSESAVGCELMIDTKNSSSAGASYYKDGISYPGVCIPGGDLDCVAVPADSPTYAVYDLEKLCNAEEKGCEYLGKPYQYDGTVFYSDIYLKNNPDKYNQILCGANAVGCQTYSYGSGEEYFKNPGDQVCEWRTASGQGNTEGWYKKKVKRCDANGNGKVDLTVAGDGTILGEETNICLSVADCGSVATPSAGCKNNADCGPDNLCLNKKCYRSNSCLLENVDIPCRPTSETKTFGYGGPGNRVSQPLDSGWAGVCPNAESGCSEYIDPLSSFNTNIIFNGNFQKLAMSETDGWRACTGGYCQNVKLDAYTVYRLARNQVAGSLTISCYSDVPSDVLQELKGDNNLGDPVSSIEVSKPMPSYSNSKIIYYTGEDKATCRIKVDSPGGSVELKKVAIDYQLADNLDKQSCNGVVDTGQGCVLFDERKQNGASLATTTFNANLPLDQQSSSPDRDANAIIKVAPDRTCDKWLACKSYIKDAKGENVCFDLGLCDAVDENGSCQNFLTSAKDNQSIENLGGRISNLSGYSKVGWANGSLKSDYYPFGAMEQVGEMAEVSNGSFEYYGSNGYPIGWTWGGGAGVWNANIFSVINNPVAAQTEGIDYAPEGSSFLKLGSSYSAESELVDVMPGTNYTITAYINTKNLKSGYAMVDILNSDGTTMGTYMTQNIGIDDWKFHIGKFKTGSDAQVKIKLHALASGKSEGNFYFDAIKIRPTLESRCLEASSSGKCSEITPPYDAWQTPQSCRLYPKNNSLACDYYEDSGKRMKGWPGYCLEYDRRPGDPNVCLLWYPIDKVKGDGIEEGAGYAGTIPVYYATDKAKRFNCSTNELVPVEKGKKFENTGSCENSDNSCDWGETRGRLTSGAGLLDFSLSSVQAYGFTATCNVRDGKDFVSTLTYNGGGSVKPVISDDKFDYFCPDSVIPEVRYFWTDCTDGVDVYPTASRKAFNQYYANKIVQVVTPMGQNKYWSGRVYEGSDYKYACNVGLPDNVLAPTNIKNCGYGTDNSPFGSVNPPAPTGNPYEWDSDANLEGYQPLYYQTAKDTAKMGQLQTVNDVKRLFAQSYDAWDWAPGVYRCSAASSPPSKRGVDCTNNRDQCPGGTCDDIITQRQACAVSRNTCQVNSCGTAPCDPYNRIENRCGSVAQGNKCCIGAHTSVVTGCSGLICKLGGTPSRYRCNGTGALCCPSGGTCDVCSSNGDILTAGTANCQGGLTCGQVTVSQGYSTCSGGSNDGEKCCSTGDTCETITTTEKKCSNSSNACTEQFCENGTCDLDTSVAGNRYVLNNSSNWGPPGRNGEPNNGLCNINGLGTRLGDSYCAILPTAANIKVNSSLDNAILTNSQFIKLSFNTKVDSQQLPLVMYGVDWGDDSKTVVTGVEMRDKPDPYPDDPAQDGDPEVIYHLYSYWNLRSKAASGVESIKCYDRCADEFTGSGEEACCAVQPQVQIKDNWGWCNHGREINICDTSSSGVQWDNFGGWVIVKEK